jgi:hypothetical protein
LTKENATVAKLLYSKPSLRTQTHLGKIKQDMNYINNAINIPAPIMSHQPHPPLGPLNPSISEALTGPDRVEWEIGYRTEMHIL